VLQSKVKTSSLDVAEEITACCKELTELMLPQTAEHALNRDAVGSDQHFEDFFLLAKLVAVSDSVRRRKDLQSAYVAETKLMTQSKQITAESQASSVCRWRRLQSNAATPGRCRCATTVSTTLSRRRRRDRSRLCQK
jgi:hypothetical protein